MRLSQCKSEYFHWRISCTIFNSRNDHDSWGLKGFRIDCIISQVQIRLSFGDKLCSRAAFGVNYKTTLGNLLVHSAMAHTAPVHKAETQNEEGYLLRKTPQGHWRFIWLYVTCQEHRYEWRHRLSVQLQQDSHTTSSCCTTANIIYTMLSCSFSAVSDLWWLSK